METPLGKPAAYPDCVDATVLAAMSRAGTRAVLEVDREMSFAGEDVWRAYEFSWLSARGMPRVGALEVRVDAASPDIVESKSMKLYLNGFAQQRFETAGAVTSQLQEDLGAAFGLPVSVTLVSLDEAGVIDVLPGQSLDDQDLEVDVYQRCPALLQHLPGSEVVAATLHTHLFRSLCPVTGQPDWASILVRYQGPALDRAALLRYLISFRGHQAFHETTVEQIFADLKTHGRCQRLLVAGYFLRRGGLDINPFRADPGERAPLVRLARQ